MKRFIAAVAALVAVLGLASAAPAQTVTATLQVSANVVAACTLQTTNIGFGTYNDLDASPLDSAGSITATCTQGTGTRLDLSYGANVIGGSTRRLAGPGGSFLSYDLYKDAARSQPWGDNLFVADSGLAIGAAPSNAPRTFPVYGRIAPGQSASAGSYADTVMVTIQFAYPETLLAYVP